MKLTRSPYGLNVLFVIIFLGIQHGLSNAKAPKGKFCKNHSYCVKYSDLDCASEWVQLNCPRMCRLCEYEGPNILNLPAVMYYKKGDKKHGISGKTKHNTKHAGKGKRIQRRSEDDGDRRDVVFLSKPYDYAPKPTTLPPTTSYNVFDYKGNHRNWLFLFPDKHPVNLRYVDQGKANDPNQQQAGASQDAAATGAPVAAGGVAAPAVAPASPAVAQPAAPAFASTAAAPSVPQVAQPTAAVAQPWNAVQTALTNQTQNKTIELINQSVSLASNDTQPPQASFAPPAANVASTQGYGAQNSTAPTEDNNMSQTQSESLNETQIFIISQSNSSKAPSQTVSGGQPYSQETPQKSSENLIEQYPRDASDQLSQTQSTAETYSQEKQQSLPLVAPPQMEYDDQSNSKQSQQSLAHEPELPQGAALESLPQTQSQSQTLESNEATTVLAQNQSGDHSYTQKAEKLLEHVSKLIPALHEASQMLSSTVSAVRPNASQTQQQSPAQPSELHRDKAQESLLIITSPPVISPPPSAAILSSQEAAKSEHRLHVDNADASTKMNGDFSPYGASVSLSGTGNMDFATKGQSVVQDTSANADAAEQTPWTCCKKVPPPEDCKPCPKLPKAPPMPYVFNIYCEDIYKDCAYAYSNCNDTWWEINCPKTCGLCKAKDKISTPTAKEIMPKEVKDLVNAELESDLVAPVPGDKPLVAKYTLRVKPKLVNGVPQMQEIRIMPPNKSGVSGYVKPLMVLKQNITKPMIENIEIDVPKKGAKFSQKPSVEVIEGDHKEMLQVNRGKAVVDDAMQRSNTKSEEIQKTKPESEVKGYSTAQAKAPASTTTERATATEQTQSSSTATQDQSSANLTSQAQTQSTSTTETTEQTAASYQQDAQSQDSSTASTAATSAPSNAETCTDDSRCATYTENQCSDPWLVTNCKSKCKLC
ncbi:uncharacterized protein [Montipora foliosa]|uniref:uncharacterized protein isoform X2 n=1 Tax=Montipora foliosa TaxID=591990 RepID=UPI0035F1FC6E